MLTLRGLHGKQLYSRELSCLHAGKTLSNPCRMSVQNYFAVLTLRGMPFNSCKRSASSPAAACRDQGSPQSVRKSKSGCCSGLLPATQALRLRLVLGSC